MSGTVTAPACGPHAHPCGLVCLRRCLGTCSVAWSPHRQPLVSPVAQAPATVVDAMRTTVRGSLGTLPPQFFNVQISSRADSFAQLLYSHMMAGYMFRNALFRMELRGALILPVLPPGVLPTHLYPPAKQQNQLCTACCTEALAVWCSSLQARAGVPVGGRGIEWDGVCARRT